MTLADSQTLDAATPTETNETTQAAKILVTVLIVLAAWGVSIFKWGVPGLYLPAVALVPVMYLLLIIMAKG